MSDELRRCWGAGCCRFVNNQPVTLEEYEKAVQRNQPGFNLPGPVEIFIGCRKNVDGVQEATETAVGFYLGSGMKRAFGTVIPDGEPPSLFERTTGKFLRKVTDEDMQKWREAWKKAVDAARQRNA